MTVFLSKNYKTGLIQRRHALAWLPSPVLLPTGCLGCCAQGNLSCLVPQFHKLPCSTLLTGSVPGSKMDVQWTSAQPYQWTACGQIRQTTKHSINTVYRFLYKFTHFSQSFSTHVLQAHEQFNVWFSPTPLPTSVSAAHTGYFIWKAHFLIFICSTAPIPKHGSHSSLPIKFLGNTDMSYKGSLFSHLRFAYKNLVVLTARHILQV